MFQKYKFKIKLCIATMTIFTSNICYLEKYCYICYLLYDI